MHTPAEKDAKVVNRTSLALQTQLNDNLWSSIFNRLREGFILGEVVRSDSGEVADWRYLVVNPAWGELVGVDARHAAGKTIRELFPGIEEAWIDDFVHVVDTGEPITFVRQVGNLGRWYEGRGFHIQGDVFAVLFIEVTDRVLQEQTARTHLRMALSAINGVGYWEWELSSGLIKTDESCAKMFGVPPALADKGAPTEAFWAKLHPDDLAATRALYESLTQTGGDLTEEHRVIDTDGNIKWVLARSCCITSPDGTASRVTGVLFDVTEQHRINDQLRQSQKMEAVGQLTGGLAHDFNNLLAGMSGALQLLEMRIRAGDSGTSLLRYISTARSAGDRAAALTHRLLAFSRKQPLQPARTDVSEMARGIEELIRHTVGPNVDVAVVNREAVWPTMVDGNQLENALVNLCVNARDAMPCGGQIVIEASNLRMHEPVAGDDRLPVGDYVCLSVSDTGTGMDEDTAARAFDPFFTTKPLGAGTGLGLSMVYGFARQSGGLAHINSVVGEGSKVSLLLPRYCDTVAVGEAGSDKHQEAAPAKVIVLVDDELIVRDFVREVLQQEGHAVLEAEDAASGLSILASHPTVDLLISDIGLPGEMNGQEMVSAARENRPNLKVLYITGYAGEAKIADDSHPEKTQLLTKPFLIETLLKRVSVMLDT